MSTFACPHCRRPIEVAALLAGLEAYAPGTCHYAARCPACRGYLEFTAAAQKLVFGYTYWAGSMHFEGMIDVAVPGLRVDSTRQPPSILFAEKVHAIPSGPPGAA